MAIQLLVLILGSNYTALIQQLVNTATGNSTASQQDIDDLKQQVGELLGRANGTDSDTESKLQELEGLIQTFGTNATSDIDGLERLIANLTSSIPGLVGGFQTQIDDLKTGIDELETGSGVGAGALGSSGRLVSIPTDGIMALGVHTVRDTRGTVEPTTAYFYPEYDFDWVTLIRENEAYDEYVVPSLNAEYNANQGAGTLRETSTTLTSELNVRGLEPYTAWALLPTGTDAITYAGVTNSAGEVLIPRTSNDGVTITRTTSFNSSSDLDIIDRGSIHDTIIVSKHGTVNDLHVTITSSSSYYRAQLISPDGTNYQVNTSGSSGSRTYIVNAVGEQMNGDWTLVYKATSGTRTLQNWTLAINHGSTGKVQSISGSGSQYTVTVGQARSGLFGLDLMNTHGIVDSSNNLLDNSLQTGPDEIHDASGSGNPCNDGGFYVCSIERSNPATEQVSTSSVEYLVTFNEDATNVDASDFVSLRSIVTVSPKVQNTAFDVWYKDEQASPSTSRISVNSINTITSAKLILDASSPNGQYVSDWKLNLTTQDGTNMIITDGSSTMLESGGGSHEFYLGEMIGLNPSNGYWTLSVIDDSVDDDPINPGTDDPEGQINSWSLEFEHASTTSRLGTIGTVRQDGANDDKYIVPVTSLYNNYNGYTLWLKGDNDIEQTSGGNMIDPREEFAPDPHESYNRGSVSIPSTPHVRGITVSGSTSSSVTFQVTFSETVTGVNATDFIVIENGSPESSGPQESMYSNAPNISINSGVITTVSDTILTSGYSDGVVDALTLNVDISHTRIGDLEVELVGPDGTLHKVHDNAGGTATNLTASFTPDFVGKPVNGNWTLQVRDNYSYNYALSTGTINSWSLDFSYEDTPTYEELLVVETQKGAAYTWKEFLSGNYILRTYPSAPVHHTPCSTNGIMMDGYNGGTACIANDNINTLVYTSGAYMKYPVSVDVDISNIRMTGPGKSDVSMRYIDGSYKAGSSFYIPIIPGMTTLKMNIAGSEASVDLADIAPAVSIISLEPAIDNAYVVGTRRAVAEAVTTVPFFAGEDKTYYVIINYEVTGSMSYSVQSERTKGWMLSSDSYSTTSNSHVDAGRGSYHAYTLRKNSLEGGLSSVFGPAVSGAAGSASTGFLSTSLDVYRNGVLIDQYPLSRNSMTTTSNSHTFSSSASIPTESTVVVHRGGTRTTTTSYDIDSSTASFRSSQSGSAMVAPIAIEKTIKINAEIGDFVEMVFVNRVSGSNLATPSQYVPNLLYSGTLSCNNNTTCNWGYTLDSLCGSRSTINWCTNHNNSDVYGGYTESKIINGYVLII